jgi:uncharacterized protein
MPGTYHSPGVYVEEVDRGSKPIEAVGTAVAAFVGFTKTWPSQPDHPLYDPDDPLGVKPRRITNWGQFEARYGGFAPGAMLPHAVYGYFNNGGGVCYVVRIPSADTDSTEARAALPAAARRELETLHVRALNAVERIEIVIETPTAPAVAEGEGEGQQPPAGTFTLKVRQDGKEVESFPDLTMGRGARGVETIVNKESKRVRVEAPAAAGVPVADRAPATGSYRLEPGTPQPATVSSEDFAGSEPERTGIRGLSIAEDTTMISVPDLVTVATRNGELDRDLYQAVQMALIDHCENSRSRMALLDAPPGLSPQDVQQWRTDAMYDAQFAALLYPHIVIANPLADRNGNGAAKQLTVPPSGHVAGIWARNDSERGVWKAPANEVVRGALNVATPITMAEQGPLNQVGINCIRTFGTSGIRLWGARTLSSNPSWRYVNVRRLFNFIEQSIERGTQWVVFEPNDFDLWQRVKRTLYSFLIGLWRQGALVGATPAQAFYIKCDEETNPPESVDEGKLVVEVGIAPVKPAEFVIFRVSQWQAGATTAE